eukprot:gene10954-13418_t
MIKSTISTFMQLPKANLIQPVSFVLHGNQYLNALSKSSNNEIAKKSLENIKVEINDKNNQKLTINARDWIDQLHQNGTGYLSLSKTPKNQTNSISEDPDFILVSGKENNLQSWRLSGNNVTSIQNPTILKTQTASSSPSSTDLNITPDQTSNIQEYHERWRHIALGDIKERFRDAVERMRDYAILNSNQMKNLSESERNTFLNHLAEAEKFIHMDVMLTTKKDLDQLFDFLRLPREYTSSSQARVALQILNAAMSAYYPLSKPSENNQKLNEDYMKLSKELQESAIDSMICSTNYIE